MLGGKFLDQAGAVQGDFLDLVFAHAEDDLAESGGTSVVQVDDGLFCAGRRLHRALDQIFARLRQNDDGHVVGDALLVDQFAHKIKVCLRGGGEADFDFLETDLDQLLEKAQLALHAHRLDQRLIAVAKVRAHPDGRMRNALARPGALGEIARERDEWTVFVGWIGDHGTPVFG
jgi:hypothetical protein